MIEHLNTMFVLGHQRKHDLKERAGLQNSLASILYMLEFICLYPVDATGGIAR